MTHLQLLDFQKTHTIFSHFDAIFEHFCEDCANFLCFLANFVPLSLDEIGKMTFLQWSHI